MTGTAVSLPHTSELFLASRWRTPSSDKVFTVLDPHSGQQLIDLPDAAIDDAKLAIDLAVRLVQDGGWSDLASEERSEFVARWRAALADRTEDLNVNNSRETGMPIRLASGMTDLGIALIDDDLELVKTVPFVEQREILTGTVEVHREAIGLTLIIGTYNGAVTGLGMSVAPALLMGNPVILKLPPENHLVGQVIAEAAAEAGFPEGALSIFAGDADVSRYLVAHSAVDAVHFTGGTKIGAEVAAVAAQRIARVTLELGGKTAAIVADDADLDVVLPTLVGGAVGNQGQMCIASTRILVSRSRHDVLVEKLVEAFGKLTVGDPLDPATEYGPLAAERVRDRTRAFIGRAVTDGATIAYGGDVPHGLSDGYYLLPTLLTGVDNSMEVAQEEVFGPVFCVIPYDDIDDAVRIANDSKYGLYGTIFTTDSDLAHDVARRVRVGQFGIDGTFPSLAAPYGGMKESGYGRVGGIEGMLELSNIKVILPGAPTSETSEVAV
ncbi:betaine-aldehyde dehydrogenase [Rhodococcus sp. ACS1]|uniref:aldehyde dehydrogenase family protein n=1 Tax=Rhodococcus sp. ACS1 TaxID=2028570 RepID=UPI000BB1195B|nr:aldehyde dehydrogenase family protein [Rhodococcus sp. ACS1]PBC35660.1 betaine-aldehyde dehydrogenase [Rhodococcus sp. ACS1]